MRKFYKKSENEMFMGVCSGIADYFNKDETLVRLIVFSLCWWSEWAFALYFLLGILLPEKNEVN